ncbi:MAG: family 10 glycosylhydrolase [Bacteroidales bacterium]|nr:family 10 glycosylhydrolase [Bacteroidales bacterium]
MRCMWLCVVLLSSTPVALAADTAKPIPREFRGVWVATVANIDWPSRPGLPTRTQQKELLAILDKCVELKLNAVIFQVRPMADALYASKIEPWSEFLTGVSGQAPLPAWDPLEFAVREAHKRKLELHAWLNPYRARTPTAKSPASRDHIINARPDLAKPYGKHYWMNPTHPEVQARSLAVILDVVKRYDVDGVHLDDYFYPYPEKDDAGKLIPFPDDDTWAVYTRSGGKLNRADWRRDAVNRFVERLYRETKAVKPWVKVGISPFGIARPGMPKGITGFDQYATLYADAKLWLNEGWVDYFTPQLYWPIAQEKQSFPKLLHWWIGENKKGRHLWPGLYTSRVTGNPKGWPAREVVDQIELVRNAEGSTGVIHFSMKALLHNTGGVADAVKKLYREPAEVPDSPWLKRRDSAD